MISITLIDTKLGLMTAYANETHLLHLSFSKFDNCVAEIKRLLGANTKIKETINTPLKMVSFELKEYFFGNLKVFKTPIQYRASDFLNKAWQALSLIDYGKTISYKHQASLIGNSKAYRAVAKANSKNPLVIILPCHRVINLSGNLGGYNGGIDKKKWLIMHEQNHI